MDQRNVSDSTARILVIDDNDDFRESLVAVIMALGHNARDAATLEDTLRQGADFAPQIIFLDIGLRGTDGSRASDRGGVRRARDETV
jgi:DNA-binding response OmpR family regulator